VLTEIRNRGVEDVCIVVCDGLKGLPESITATWPAALIQTCVHDLIRGTFRLAGRQHRLGRPGPPISPRAESGCPCSGSSWPKVWTT